MIETDSRKIFLRNRHHIYKAPQKYPPDASESASNQEFENISNQSQPTGVSDLIPNPPPADHAPVRNRYTTRSRTRS